MSPENFQLRNLQDLGLHSLVTIAVNPVQFVTTTEEKPLQRQFLPPNEGVGLLHSLMCDTVTSPHDPLFLGHDGNMSSLQPPSTGIKIAYLIQDYMKKIFDNTLKIQ